MTASLPNHSEQVSAPGTRPDVSVVLPCLDEADSIASCVRAARASLDAAGLSGEVVVCDNGSSDGSGARAADAGARVVTEPRRGYGRAYAAGIASATGRTLVLADADGTYPLERCAELAALAAERGALVLGSRFAGRIQPGSMPALHRLVGSPATRLLLRLLFGVRGSDPHSGMRAMKREIHDRVRPHSPGMEYAIEMIVNAARAGIEVIEVPIDYRPRAGHSKLRALPDGWALLRFLLVHSPGVVFLYPGLASSLAGALTLAWLLPGNRRVAGVNLAENTMVVACLVTVVGFQAVTLGVSGRVVSGARQAGFVRTRFTLERGLLLGTGAVAVGLLLLASVGLRWLASDFGDLRRADHGVAMAGLTLSVLGFQTIFASFFLSLLLADE